MARRVLQIGFAQPPIRSQAIEFCDRSRFERCLPRLFWLPCPRLAIDTTAAGSVFKYVYLTRIANGMNGHAYFRAETKEIVVYK